MNSIVIVSKNKELALGKINEICKSEQILNIDKNVVEFEKAAGIPDVREIQKKLFFKPVRSKNKAVIIMAAQGITLQAQNALLKILEEPPENTFIFLTAAGKNDLIPTVLSRCKIIELEKEINFDEEGLENAEKILLSLGSGEFVDRLKLAQDFSTNRDEALVFLENAISSGRKNLLRKQDDSKLLNTINQLQELYSILKNTNATARLAMENLFLSL